MTAIKPFPILGRQEPLDSSEQESGETSATEEFVLALEGLNSGPVPDDSTRGFCELFKIEVAQAFTCDTFARRFGEEIEAAPNYRKASGGNTCAGCMYWGPLEDARVGVMVQPYKDMPKV